MVGGEKWSSRTEGTMVGLLSRLFIVSSRAGDKRRGCSVPGSATWEAEGRDEIGSARLVSCLRRRSRRRTAWTLGRIRGEGQRRGIWEKEN